MSLNVKQFAGGMLVYVAGLWLIGGPARDDAGRLVVNGALLLAIPLVIGGLTIIGKAYRPDPDRVPSRFGRVWRHVDRAGLVVAGAFAVVCALFAFLSTEIDGAWSVVMLVLATIFGGLAALGLWVEWSDAATAASEEEWRDDLQ